MTETVLLQHTQARDAARGVVAGTLAALALSVLVSTLLHHGRPDLLGVPPLDEIPYATLPVMALMDLGAIAVSAVCLRHAWRRHGAFLAIAFLVGSFVFTGLEETMWILIGRFVSPLPTPIPGSLLGTLVPNGTYYFTRGFFWFLETPVSACLGWFVMAYSSMWVVELVQPRAGVVWQAALAGLLATNLDLWFDPVQTHPALLTWIWADPPGGLRLFSIPITNFIGWFLLIFLFALVFARLPGWTSRLGPRRAMVRFYGVLLALELAILLFFTVYTALEQRVFQPKWNLTVREI